ncbi:MAG: Hsp20/alpha crystallin family protein [Candidatus Parcubacteria bacterium]|nr:Hsp20/alpha crystallin family protein [Candidatus Parcubacteria bacterium]
MANTKKSTNINISENNWPSSSEEGQLTMDVYQTPTEIIVKSAIAGVSPKDLDISITNDMVTVRGKREQEEEVEEDNYFYRECFWGTFSRSVILPMEVDANEAKATFKNGVLTIKLPKVEKVRTKRLDVDED